MHSTFARPPAHAFSVEGLIDTIKFNYSPRVTAHLKSVYSLLGICLTCVAVGSYVAVRGLFMAGSYWGSFLAFLGILGVLFIPNEKQNLKTRVGLLMASAFLMGHGMWPLILTAIELDPSLIITSLLGTAVVFVAFSLGALTARPGSYMYLGHTIFFIMSMMSMLVLSQVVFGFPGVWMFTIYPYLMLAVSCAFVLYDTQMIAFRCSLGQRDVVIDAALLLIDFLEIFRFLLKITSEKAKDEKRRK